MLEPLVLASIRARTAVLIALLVLIGAGGYAASRLPIDAMPDVTTVQVSVLTRTGGLSADVIFYQIASCALLPIDRC